MQLKRKGCTTFEELEKESIKGQGHRRKKVGVAKKKYFLQFSPKVKKNSFFKVKVTDKKWAWPKNFFLNFRPQLRKK